MDFTFAYDIELPLLVPPEQAAAAYADPAGYPEWQTGFVAFDLLEGEAFAPGSRAELTFAYGSHPMSMTQEVLDAGLPDLLRCRYTSGGYVNVTEDRFLAGPEGSTVWRAHHEWDMSALELVEPPGEADRLRFQATTAASMEAFKRYVEALPRP